VLVGRLLIESRNGLIVDVCTTHTTRCAEREAPEVMLAGLAHGRRVTVGADKSYDTIEPLPTFARWA
jgi:hypothetical protein